MPRAIPQRNPSTFTRPKPIVELAPDPEFADTEDQVFGLVSVLYHSLQGAQACEQYIGDAERADDAELVTFFEECRRAQNERALRAKQLLGERMDEATADAEDSDEDEDEDEA
jgi:hypothetical protein